MTAAQFLAALGQAAQPIMDLAGTAASICIMVALLWGGYRIVSRLIREGTKGR